MQVCALLWGRSWGFHGAFIALFHAGVLYVCALMVFSWHFRGIVCAFVGLAHCFHGAFVDVYTLSWCLHGSFMVVYVLS